MMTKIRTNGSSDTSMLSPPPPATAAWAKAGVMNMNVLTGSAARLAAPAGIRWPKRRGL